MDVPPPFPPAGVPPENDAVSSIIPYRNAPALIGYYCAVFSLIPCLGFILGLVALILGIVGLRAAKRQPTAKGKAHAWVGIILGGLTFLAHLALAVTLGINAAGASRAH